MSFDVILPLLRPIAHLIQDPELSEIMVNGSRRVFVERDGLLSEVAGVSLDERTFRVDVKKIARALGDEVSDEQPILDVRLTDGSRVAAVCPPCSVGGTTQTIGKIPTRFFTAEELVRTGATTPEALSTLRDAIGADPLPRKLLRISAMLSWISRTTRYDGNNARRRTPSGISPARVVQAAHKRGKSRPRPTTRRQPIVHTPEMMPSRVSAIVRERAGFDMT
jgi:hypothetical protein